MFSPRSWTTSAAFGAGLGLCACVGSTTSTLPDRVHDPALAARVEARVPAAPPGHGLRVELLQGMVWLSVRDEAASTVTKVLLVRTPGPDEEAREPHCRGGGVDVLRSVGDPPAAWLAALCDAVAVNPPPLPPPPERAVVRRARKNPGVPVPIDPWIAGTGQLMPVARNPLHLLWLAALAWLAVGLGALVRRPAVWAAARPRVLRAAVWGGVALLARLMVGPWVLMGAHYPYLRASLANGSQAWHPLYGYGWSGLLGPLHALTGGHPLWLHQVNTVWSVLTVMVVAAWLPRRLAGWAAGALALTPAVVAMGRTEVMWVFVAFGQTVALLGAWPDRLDRSEGALPEASVRWRAWGAGIGLAAAASVRPGAVLAAPVALWGLWRQRAWGPLVWSAATCGAVLSYQLRRIDPRKPDSAYGFDQLPLWASPSRLVGDGGSLVVLDPWMVPAGLTVLVLAGLLAVLRPAALRARIGSTRVRADRQWLALVAVAVVLASAPFAHLPRVTDVVRMQLPAIGMLCIGAAVPMSWLWLRNRALAGGVALGVALSAGLSWGALPLESTFRREHAALVHGLAMLPDDAVLAIHNKPNLDDGQLVAAVDGWHRGKVKDAAKHRSTTGSYRWVGRHDVTAGVVPAVMGEAPRWEGCTWEVLHQRTVPVNSHDIEQVPGDTVVVGLYRAKACPSADDGSG